jgi:rhodanese-related sulfurtransferase
MKRVVPLILLVLIITICTVYFSTNDASILRPSLEISVADARTRRFGLILDVRSLQEREEMGFYPNSIPFDPEDWKKDGLVGKATSIMVYSNGDGRAQRIAEQLYQAGYQNIHYITSSFTSLLPGSQ